MPDGWASTDLGSVIEPVQRPVAVEEGIEYPLLGVRWYGEGPFLREVGVSGEMKTKKLYRTQAGDFIYNRLFAWKGSFGVISPELDGCFVSGEFPLFRVDESRLLTEYLNHVMCQPAAWTQIERESTGSTATSRNRWKVERLLEWRVSLPPVAHQHRIVDLIARIDRALAAAAEVRSAYQAVTESLVTTWVTEWRGPTRKLGDLAGMGSGPSWKADEESSVPTDDALRVIGITNTPAGSEMDLTEEKYVAGLPKAVRTLSESSLLMVRTNGNRARIGNVYRTPTAAIGCPYSAFQIGLDFESSTDARFAYWMLNEQHTQSRISDAASGTTGLGNIAQRWLRELELPWPDTEDLRHEAAELFDLGSQARASADAVVAATRSARAAILTDLLTGGHEITDQYDELLERAS